MKMFTLVAVGGQYEYRNRRVLIRETGKKEEDERLPFVYKHLKSNMRGWLV
jgi:hypothetical protein